MDSEIMIKGCDYMLDEIFEPTTKELFTQLQKRLKFNLEENEIICPECKGLRFILVQTKEKSYIQSCNRCHNGTLFICKHCGQSSKSMCWCSESLREIPNEQVKKIQAIYDNAEKINFKDYDGRFILNDEGRSQSKDDIEEWIYNQLTDGNQIPDYLWATKAIPAFNIDLKEIVYNKCEDYEDMFDQIDISHPLLKMAQEFISQWEQEQGESLTICEDDFTRAVIITDIVNKIKDQIEAENNKKGRD
jgi:hypothetical protein